MDYNNLLQLDVGLTPITTNFTENKVARKH